MLCEPTSYNEVQEIADYILNKRAVVINLQNMDQHQAKRIIDFLRGLVLPLMGASQKPGWENFLFAPQKIDGSAFLLKRPPKNENFNNVGKDSWVQIMGILIT